MITRRTFSATLPLIAITACSTTTTNGKTTIAVNVAEAIAYSNAAAAAVDALLAFPGVSSALGSKLPEVRTAVLDVTTVGAAVQNAASSSQTFTFDTTNPPAFLTALAANVGTLRTDVGAAMAALGSSAAPQVTTYYQAVLAILTAISALFQIQAA